MAAGSATHGGCAACERRLLRASARAPEFVKLRFLGTRGEIEARTRRHHKAQLARGGVPRPRGDGGLRARMVRKGNREAIAGSASISVAFTGVLYLVTDLVFGTGEAIVVAVAFFAFIAPRRDTAI